MSFEEKYSGKTFGFFEWVYRLVVINLITLLLSVFILPLLPALSSAVATIKDTMEGNGTDVLKLYFRNFRKYMEKAFLVQLVLFIIVLVAGISIYFYLNVVGLEKIWAQAGFGVMVIVILIVIITSLHLPLILITFPALPIAQVFRTSLFITFRFFLSTLILLACLILLIAMLPFLPISALVGISLPLFLGFRLTRPVYMYLEKIDLQKIMYQAEEENE